MQSNKPNAKSKGKSTKQTQKNIRKPLVSAESIQSSKVYLQDIEQKLKNCDHQSQLMNIINKQLMHEIKRIRLKYESLKQHCARIILAINRHPPYRSILSEIKDLILPLLMETYLYINQHIASDLIIWAYQANILPFYDNLVEDLVQKLRKSPKSTFLSSLIKLIVRKIKTKEDQKLYNFCPLITLFLKQSICISSSLAQILLQGFTHFIVHGPLSKIDPKFKLMFEWAYLSLSPKCQNKDFFKNIMKISSQIKNKSPANINVISSLLIPFSSNKLDNNKKFLVLIEYSEFILQLIQYTNYEDNLNEKQVKKVLQSIFFLGSYCDTIKSKTLLEQTIRSLPQIPQIQENPNLWEFQSCQNIIYRILLSAQKCLPNYPLKYYYREYIQRPGFFHLYFIDEIIKKREPYEIKDVMKGLIQAWIDSQLRDFNILSYLSKFIYSFAKNEHRIRVLIAFLREISTDNLIKVNKIFYENCFPQLPNNGSILPATLSFQQQQSQIKSCGFSNRSLFVDRFFMLPQELVMWEPLLEQIIEDNFYFVSKYFYFLITSAFNPQIQADIDITNHAYKIFQIIDCFEESVKKNKYAFVFSTFQILICIENLDTVHLQRIGKILFEKFKDLIKLMDNAQVVWRESLRATDISEEDVQKYRQKQKKFKRMHLHFLKSILRICEKLDRSILSLIPSQIAYESSIDIIKKYQQQISIIFSVTVHRSVRLLSSKSANNIFLSDAEKYLKQNMPNRTKYEILRQSIFAYFQAGSIDEQQNLKKLVSFDQAFKRCYNFVISQINPLYQKQTVTCKLIAFQGLSQCFRTYSRKINRSVSILQSKSSQFCQLVSKILFKDVRILGKYERKAIMILRCECLRWIQENLINKQYFVSKQQIFAILFHLTFDESPQIRLYILKIISDYLMLQQIKNQQQQAFEDFISLIVILHVFAALDPKIRIRSLAQKIIMSFLNTLTNKFSVILLIILKMIDYLMNIEIWMNLPIYEIFLNISKLWLTSKETQYIVYQALKQIYENGNMKQIQNRVKHGKNNEGFKVYYLNPKQKKSWISGKYTQKQKKTLIYQTIKKCLIIQNKNARYLRSKKQMLFNYQSPFIGKILINKNTQDQS